MVEKGAPLLEVVKKVNIVQNIPAESLPTPTKQVDMRRNKMTPQKPRNSKED